MTDSLKTYRRMNYRLQTRDISVSTIEGELIDNKLQRLSKRLREPFEIDVTLTRDQHHRHGDVITCTLKIVAGKHVMYAERQGATIQDTLDAAMQALKREIDKQHDKSILLRRVIKRFMGR